jgi:hypothetical protein
MLFGECLNKGETMKKVNPYEEGAPMDGGVGAVAWGIIIILIALMFVGAIICG